MNQTSMKNFEEVKLPEISKLLNLINGTNKPDDQMDGQEEKENDEIDPQKEILKDHLPGFKVDKVPFLREHFHTILDNILTVEGQIAIVVFDHVRISLFALLNNAYTHSFHL